MLTRRDVEAMCQAAPGATCMNYYGATETQRTVSYHVVRRETATLDTADRVHLKQLLPVGMGIPNVGKLAGVLNEEIEASS